nr:antibiotic biosynthesis monooxygenase family protein [Micromonospora sp. DSM 115978]
MLVVTRFDVPEDEAGGFAERAERVVEAFGRQPGYRSARLARAVDEPELWALVTEWDDARSWRRALSAFDVRVEFAPLAARARDDAGAYEVLFAQDGPGGEPRRSSSARARDAGSTGPGRRQPWDDAG